MASFRVRRQGACAHPFLNPGNRFAKPFAVPKGITLVELLMIFLVIALLVTLLLPAMTHHRGPSLRTHCSNQLKQVILAMHTFEGPNRRIPGAKGATIGRFSMHAEILLFIDQQPLYDRLNFDIKTPSILDIAVISGPLTSAMGSPSGNPFTFADIPETQAGTGASLGSHRLAAFTKLMSFNCPVDMGPTGVASGNSYCPVVTASGARDSTGALLEALWPATAGEGISGSVPSTSPIEAGWGKRMNPPNLGGIADGTSNTIGMVERVKGWGAGGRQVPTNAAWAGPASRFLVDGAEIPDQAHGEGVAGDNRNAVAACRASMDSGRGSLTGAESNDRSGSQWLQYTCHWLGCANTMGPPNSAVCGPAGRDFAEAGIAPPSSFHSGGANCGFMDGTVRFITDAVDVRIFHSLGTASGGEQMTLPP